MKIYFSFDYKGGMAYLGMSERPTMMDTQVVNLNKLLDFMELRLGLHTKTKSDTERLVAYYKCVRDYMQNVPDNQLFGSYTISPLSTSREMLKWRDALSVCGWTKETPAPSRRLKVLQDVECLFKAEEYADVSIRLKKIIDRLKAYRGMMKGVTFVMPYDMNLLSPALKEIFELAIDDGATVEQLEVPAIEGNDNLSKLKRLLTAEEAKTTTLDPEDSSVRIWNFKDDMEAEEMLAMLGDDKFDIIINPNTKLTDNYLRMMGKPVTGSSVANSAPQIIQLFFTGVALMARPLNIGALMQWLYAPLSPLPAKLRYRIAACLARSGGWCSKESDGRSTNCYQIVQEWIECKADPEVKEQEKTSRQHKVSVFLPDFEGGSDDSLTAEKLHIFLTELSVWSKQSSAIIVQNDKNDLRIAQLDRLSELCETLKNLTDDYQPTTLIPFTEIEKHVASLYEPSEFVQYKSQATSRLTISVPGQVSAKADKVLWAGLYDFEPMLPATDFLTPTESNVLKEHIRLWNKDDVRKIQQMTMMLPLLFCQKKLVLVTLDRVGGNPVNKHPLVVRIEQQVKNHSELTCTPKVDEGFFEPCDPLKNNSTSDPYVKITQKNLINWRQHESPTSVEKLIQNPLDYTLENIAFIHDNGQSDLSNLSITKGNVAHGVIQQLFYLPGDKQSGYPAAIKARVKKDYRRVFDKVVETKGAILLLQENVIELRQLFGQLRECIDHLLDIIEKDNLHVVDCEKQLDGNTFGAQDDNTPAMHGFADMVLARESGQQIIFDFKWTLSKNYYQRLLNNNRSSQLAIYADLLKEETQDKSISTAYFLMPRGRLFSTTKFNSYYASEIKVNEDCHGDIVSKIVNSYRYRRDEIMSGKIELGEGMPLTDLDYFNETESKGLFPLEPQNGNESVKEIYNFSIYSHLKN